MSKYNEQLIVGYVEAELGNFIKENNAVLSTTVGETILIMGATTDFINDLLQGLTTKEQRILVVDSTLEHVKKLMLQKVGAYEEDKNSKKNDKPKRRT